MSDCCLWHPNQSLFFDHDCIQPAFKSQVIGILPGSAAGSNLNAVNGLAGNQLQAAKMVAGQLQDAYFDC
jgi:hypothetical protein